MSVKKELITIEDVESGAVFAGYDATSSLRAAHRRCWNGLIDIIKSSETEEIKKMEEVLILICPKCGGYLTFSEGDDLLDHPEEGSVSSNLRCKSCDTPISFERKDTTSHEEGSGDRYEHITIKNIPPGTAISFGRGSVASVINTK